MAQTRHETGRFYMVMVFVRIFRHPVSILVPAECIVGLARSGFHTYSTAFSNYSNHPEDF